MSPLTDDLLRQACAPTTDASGLDAAIRARVCALPIPQVTGIPGLLPAVAILFVASLLTGTATQVVPWGEAFVWTAAAAAALFALVSGLLSQRATVTARTSRRLAISGLSISAGCVLAGLMPWHLP
jgi:hypothetical protein